MANMDRIGKTHTKVTTVKLTETDVARYVSYHRTNVVIALPKRIVLNTGGHWTRATKTRMNQASNQWDLGYQVYQKNWNWFVSYKGKTFTEQTLTLER